MTDTLDRLFDRLNSDDVAALSYEEREAVADATLAASLEGAALSPRALILATDLAALLGGVKGRERESLMLVVVEELTAPRSGRMPSDLSDDELEREVERRRKYGHGTRRRE